MVVQVADHLVLVQQLVHQVETVVLVVLAVVVVVPVDHLLDRPLQLVEMVVPVFVLLPRFNINIYIINGENK